MTQTEDRDHSMPSDDNLGIDIHGLTLDFVDDHWADDQIIVLVSHGVGRWGQLVRVFDRLRVEILMDFYRDLDGELRLHAVKDVEEQLVRWQAAQTTLSFVSRFDKVATLSDEVGAWLPVKTSVPSLARLAQ